MKLGGNGGGLDGRDGELDGRMGGGKTLAGSGTELNRLLNGGISDPSDGVIWIIISILAL